MGSLVLDEPPPRVPRDKQGQDTPKGAADPWQGSSSPEQAAGVCSDRTHFFPKLQLMAAALGMGRAPGPAGR